MNETLKDKIRGCFLGVAIGDALGAPVETMTHYQILKATNHAEITGYAPQMQTKIKGTRKLEPGSTTDDTQLTLAVARSLIRCGGFNAYDQARELVAEFDRTTFGWGKSTTAGAQELKKWFKTNGAKGRRPDMDAPPRMRGPGTGGGNGVAMKIAPLALASLQFGETGPGYNSFDHQVMRLGFQTHGDLRSSFAALAVGHAINLFGCDELRLLGSNDVLLRFVFHAERHYAEYACGDPAFSARLVLALNGLKYAEFLRKTVGPGFSALESVPFSIATALRYPDDFRSGVLEAVNAGGDADTNASMVGAMIGVRVGIAGIPKEWIDGLRAKSKVLRVADRFAECFFGKSS